MKLELNLTNLENLPPITPELKAQFEKIFTILIQAGGLTGVKSGKTILHFDKYGTFRSVQLDYFPFERRDQ